jgi:hypothetical protein
MSKKQTWIYNNKITASFKNYQRTYNEYRTDFIFTDLKINVRLVRRSFQNASAFPYMSSEAAMGGVCAAPRRPVRAGHGRVARPLPTSIV